MFIRKYFSLICQNGTGTWDWVLLMIQDTYSLDEIRGNTKLYFINTYQIKF